MIVLTVRIPKIHHFKERQFEWGMGIALSLWALNLSVEPVAFSNPGWSFIRSVAPVEVWTTFSCLTAAVRLVALYINGAMQASPFLRSLTAFLSGLFWMSLAAGLMATGSANTGWPVYSVFAAADLYAAYQATKDARLAWELRKRGKTGARPRRA